MGVQRGVDWRGALSNGEVIALYAAQDVFVLPTRVGRLSRRARRGHGRGTVVPVVSDIDSGVPEVVESDRTGARPASGDIRGFAEAIASLDADRAASPRMSAAARDHASQRASTSATASPTIRRCTRAGRRALSSARRWQPCCSTAAGSIDPWLPNAAVVRRSARPALAAR